MKIYIYDKEEDKKVNIPVPNFLVLNKTLIKFYLRKGLEQADMNGDDTKVQKIEKLLDTNIIGDAIDILYKSKRARGGEFTLVEIDDANGDKIKISF